MRRKMIYPEFFSNEVLKKFLDDHKIKYKTLYDLDHSPYLIAFSIFDDDPAFQELPNYTQSRPTSIINVYTKKELLSASYLEFFPARPVVDRINLEQTFDYPCKWFSKSGMEQVRHCIQKSFITIKPFNTNNTTVFYNDSAGCMFIFAKKMILPVLLQNGITGIRDFPVYLNRKGKTVEAEIVQLLAQETIPSDVICIDDNDRFETCPICGKKAIIAYPGYELKLWADKMVLNNDFYMTEPIFGEGITRPKYIVSQKFYQLILQEKYHKNLVFEPVKFRTQDQKERRFETAEKVDFYHEASFEGTNRRQSGDGYKSQIQIRGRFQCH